jgi:hypothetical protein
MEEASFIRYVRRRRRGARESARSTEKDVGTSAHLCEVLRLVQPQELDRNPTWFGVEKTKKKLLEGRTAEFGIELIRVVDRAVARILAAHAGSSGVSPANSHLRGAGHSRSNRNSVEERYRGKVLPIRPTLVVDANFLKRLPEGTSLSKAGSQSAATENERDMKPGPKVSVSARKKRD